MSFCKYTVNGDYMCNNNIENFDTLSSNTNAPTSSEIVNTPSPASFTSPASLTSPIGIESSEIVNTLSPTSLTGQPSLTSQPSPVITESSEIKSILKSDKYSNCPLLALQNQCKLNPTYMLQTCPVSCNNIINNSDLDCQKLVNNKNCLINANQMLDLCPTSCVNNL